MNNLFRLSKKKTVSLYGVLLLIFIGITAFFIYEINNQVRNAIVKTESQEFVELYIHMRVELDRETAIHYAEDYSKIMKVGLIIHENDELIYTSSQELNHPINYTFSADGIDYFIQVDAYESQIVEVTLTEMKTAIVVLFLIYQVVVIVLVFVRRNNNEKTHVDINRIQELLRTQEKKDFDFHYVEFKDIYNDVYDNLTTIELCRQRSKDFTNGLMHDLKTPLTILKFHLEEASDENYLLKNRDIILESLSSISDIATDIISEKFEKDFHSINISKIIENEVQKYSKAMESKGIRINSSIDKDLEVVWSKRDVLRVIQNLLSNAYYYSYDNTEVFVRVSERGNHCFIEVINEGDTLDEDFISIMFDKGSRGNSKNNSGNGIGLYITKLLINLANGKISFKCDKDKNIFEVEVPLKD